MPLIFPLFFKNLIFINIIELKRNLLSIALDHLDAAGMNESTEKVYEPFWKVTKLLLSIEGESKMVSKVEVRKLIIIEKYSRYWEKSNVFSYNQVTKEIGFGSRAIQFYLQQRTNNSNNTENL